MELFLRVHLPICKLLFILKDTVKEHFVKDCFMPRMNKMVNTISPSSIDSNRRLKCILNSVPLEFLLKLTRLLPSQCDRRLKRCMEIVQLDLPQPGTIQMYRKGLSHAPLEILGLVISAFHGFISLERTVTVLERVTLK